MILHALTHSILIYRHFWMIYSPFLHRIFHQEVSTRNSFIFLNFACLHMVTAFWRSYCPFSHRILHKKDCNWNSSQHFIWEFLKTACLLITIWKSAYYFGRLIQPILEKFSPSLDVIIDRSCLCAGNSYILNMCFIMSVWYLDFT